MRGLWYVIITSVAVVSVVALGATAFAVMMLPASVTGEIMPMAPIGDPQDQGTRSDKKPHPLNSGATPTPTPSGTDSVPTQDATDAEDEDAVEGPTGVNSPVPPGQQATDDKDKKDKEAKEAKEAKDAKEAKEAKDKKDKESVVEPGDGKNDKPTGLGKDD
jgi:hypothetical protein